MKRWIVVLAAVMAIAPCYAQDVDAAKRAKVEELMSTMHVDKMMGQMMDMAKAQVQQSAAGMPGADSMTPAQKKIYEDFQQKSLDLVMQSVSWKSIEPEIVKLYTDTFTEQEIDGIVAFYKSPSGQAMLNKTPQLMTGMMQFMQGRIGDLQPKVKALTDQFAKDMAAAGPSPATK
jgi:hypothetical protein